MNNQPTIDIIERFPFVVDGSGIRKWVDVLMASFDGIDKNDFPSRNRSTCKPKPLAQVSSVSLALRNGDGTPCLLGNSDNRPIRRKRSFFDPHDVPF